MARHKHDDPQFEGVPGGFDVSRPTHLGAVARRLYRERRTRDEIFKCDMLHEGGWDILLDLYASMAEGRQVSITSACLAAYIPNTTAQRLVHKLEREGVLQRRSLPHDRRVRLVELSPKALAMMSSYLEQVQASRSEWARLDSSSSATS